MSRNKKIYKTQSNKELNGHKHVCVPSCMCAVIQIVVNPLSLSCHHMFAVCPPGAEWSVCWPGCTEWAELQPDSRWRCSTPPATPQPLLGHHRRQSWGGLQVSCRRGATYSVLVVWSVVHWQVCFCVCSELQTEALRQQSFEQKCESWMSFLQRMEDGLAADVAGSYTGLRQQFCTHKVSGIINRHSDKLHSSTLITGRKHSDVILVSPGVSEVSGRTFHWSPDPTFGHHWSSSSAAERRGGGQVIVKYSYYCTSFYLILGGEKLESSLFLVNVLLYSQKVVWSVWCFGSVHRTWACSHPERCSLSANICPSGMKN